MIRESLKKIIFTLSFELACEKFKLPWNQGCFENVPELFYWNQGWLEIKVKFLSCLKTKVVFYIGHEMCQSPLFITTAHPPNFKKVVYVFLCYFLDWKFVQLIKNKCFSVNDIKNYKISMFLNQVVAVKKYYPVLPAVPKNRGERRKTVSRAAPWLRRQTHQRVEHRRIRIKYWHVPPPR